MLAGLLIGLREGLEASLIVGILIAYLVKIDLRSRIKAIWTGVISAVVFSVVLGIGVGLTSESLSEFAEKFFAGTMSFIAVGFVTGMIFWMRAASKGLAKSLRTQVDSALIGGGAFGLAALSFAAVAREGVETSIFLWAAAQNSGSLPTLVGGFTGIAISIFLGYLIYLGAVKLNLSVFFRITGLLLMVVAAGVLTYGIHEYQELGWLPGLNSIAYDFSNSIDPAGFVATLLKGLLSLRTSMSWLELFAYISYIVIVAAIFLRPGKAVNASKDKVKVS
jgi:high-affinity iron transporter